MRRRVLAIALAVVTAIALVVLRWHSLVPPSTPELPSSQPKSEHPPRLVTPVADLAYHEGGDDGAYDWRLAGRVIDELGAPASGAHLEIDLVCHHIGEQDAPAVDADRDGRFAFELVPDCTIWLYAARGDQSARMLLSSLPGAPITVQLARDNDIVVHVVDIETRAPVRGVHLIQSFCPHQAGCRDVTGDGTIRLGHALSVHVHADGYEDGQLELADVWSPRRGTPQLEQMVELYALRRVTGRVLDGDGAPIAGAVLHSYVPSSGPLQQDPRTDANGHFELTAPANAWISAQTRCADGPTAGWSDGVTAAATTVDLHITRTYRCAPPSPPPPPPPQPLYVPPPQPAASSVVLTVVDELGLPVPDAQIRTFRETMGPARTDAAGRVQLRIDRATDDLYARRGNRTSPVVAVEPDGGHHEYTLHLRPAALTGIVVDRAGDPVAKAWVRFRLPGLTAQPTYRELRSDAEGHFGAVLPAGSYTISAFRETSIEDDFDGPNATVIETNTRDVTFEIP